jgi:hypothetical protein
MKSLIKKILEGKGFIVDENILKDEGSLLSRRTENNKFDFLTVMLIENKDIKTEKIKEKIEEYLLKIVKNQQIFVGVEKNLSLLLLIEVDSLENSREIAALIYDIEEDPYDFKKFVLTYTKHQVELLKSYIGTSEGNVISCLNDILNNPTTFSKFKNHEDSEEVLIYDLVSKLFIKIPFLNLDNNQQAITNLYEKIVERIDDRDKDLWESLMQLNENSGNNPDIEEILECIGVETFE